MHPTLLHKWKNTVIENMTDLFKSEAKKNVAVINKEHEKQVEQLYSDIGRLTTQLAWIKKIWPQPCAAFCRRSGAQTADYRCFETGGV